METNEYKVVGSSCLADFLGHDNPADVVKLFEYLSQATGACEDSEGGGSYEPTRFDLGHYLGFVAANIRCDGWLSRTNARNTGRDGQATADQAWGVMVCMSIGKDVRPCYKPTKEDFARATLAIEYLQVFIDGELEKGPVNDYLYNLIVLLRVNSVNHKTAGLGGSILPTAEREMGKEVERRRFLNLKATSKHLATKGEKVKLTATVLSVKELETDYGVSTLIKFASEGNALAWFASGSKGAEWIIGQTYNITGTVKSHDEFQGLKETKLTRVNGKPA